MALFGRSLPVIGLSAFFLLPRPAVADPVTITSGYLETFRLMTSTNGVFQGEGFSMTATSSAMPRRSRNRRPCCSSRVALPSWHYGVGVV
jgi:hypothetical protein